MRNKKKANTKRKSHDKKHTKTTTSTWVDRVVWQQTLQNEPQEHVVSIVSWNVLAQAYLTKRSHCGLPKQHDSLVFCPKQRLVLLQKCLRKLTFDKKTDVICLQEVDQPIVHETLKTLGYQGVSTPTTKGGGSGGRVDACCIYYLAQHWTLVKSRVIHLDDLAFNTVVNENEDLSDYSNSMDENNSSNHTRNKNKDSSLRGLQQSFLRRNNAILVQLRHGNASIVVVNCHLYWHPQHEHVKLCQVHYIMKSLEEFNSDQDPVVVCGDFNSQPNSHVHNYLTRGWINAKHVAPWYHYNNVDANDEDEVDCNEMIDELDSLTITTKDKNGSVLSNKLLKETHMVNQTINGTIDKNSPPCIRYLLDFTLNRFTRWLRILGIDAALETDEEEIQRTKHGNFVILERCRVEKRTLLTTSSKLMLRKDCPPGAYLVNPRVSLESTLVHLLTSHGVVLVPRNFLTRCVVCNGMIQEVLEQEQKRIILETNQAPTKLISELDVYRCNGCGQGYWWCDKPSSSAARVKNQATRLFQVCLRGGIPIMGDLHMFDFVNVKDERELGLTQKEYKNYNELHLQVVDWLKDERLSHNLKLRSAYATEPKTTNDAPMQELLPFTNVTHDFVGTLDYIVLDATQLCQTHLLHVPRTFDELNGSKIGNGHLLPSNIWPSDHLAIGACFALSSARSKDIQENDSESTSSQTNNAIVKGERDDHEGKNKSVTGDPTIQEENTNFVYCASTNDSAMPPPPISAAPVSHGQRCACGCVPKVLSLFEMAELRKQAKLKAQSAKPN